MIYVDAHKILKSDKKVQTEIVKVLNKVAEIEAKTQKSFDELAYVNNELLRISKLVGYNMALFLPHYFPKYPKDTPFSLKDRPFAYHFFAPLVGMTLVIMGSRQTGKSTSISARQRMFAHIFSGYKSLYVAPMSEHIETYKNKFREIEMSFRYPVNENKFRQNLQYKEYPNKSIIEMINLYTDVTKVRGKTYAEVIVDEVQHFDPSFEPELMAVQDATDTPSNIYAGTSTTKDTMLQGKWEESSQGIWVMKCSSCGHWNEPTIEGKVMDMIQPSGICCSHCGAPLDVRDGELVHQNKEFAEMGFIGMHVPQIIVPFVVEDEVKYNKLYLKKLKMPEHKFFNEVLGIATEDGERELSYTDVKSMCDPMKTEAMYLQQVQKRQYKWIVSGSDWGGSDYDARLKTKESYTTQVILGLKPTGEMDILFFRRYSGMKYEEIIDEICKNLKLYKVDFVGSDQGVGQFYNTVLRQRFPTQKHLIFQYVRGECAELAINKNGTNMYLLNRDESLSSLFMAIRKGRFTTYRWEDAETYLTDFLNMMRVPDELVNSGRTIFRYRKHGTKTDDCLHGLNFAFSVMRMLTNESLYGNVILQNVMLQNMQPGTSPIGRVGVISG